VELLPGVSESDVLQNAGKAIRQHARVRTANAAREYSRRGTGWK
jgi:hypothetical protein